MLGMVLTSQALSYNIPVPEGTCALPLDPSLPQNDDKNQSFTDLF